MSHKKAFYPIVFLTLFLGNSLFGQDTTRFNLDQAIDYAYLNNLTIRNAQLEISDAEQQIIERRATGIPKIDGSANYQRYLQVPIAPLPDPLIELLRLLSPNEEIASEGSFFLKNNLTLGLSLETMIFDGSYFVGLQAAKAYRKYVQEDLSTKKRDAKNNVTDAFLPVLLIDANLGILEKNISNLNKLFFETKQLYQEGFVEQLDVDRLELSLSNLTVQKDNLERQKVVALDRLKLVMGFPLDESIVLEGQLMEFAEELGEEAMAGSFDVNSRPEVRLANVGLELNELNLKLNRVGYLPSLRGNAAYNRQFQGDTFSDGFWASTTFVGLNLSVPIFDGFDRKAKIQRAKIDIQETLNQKTDLIRGINFEVRTARNNYLNALRNKAEQNRNLALAERIYNTTQVKYKEGVGSSIEVTQAEQSMYTTQSNYLQSVYEFVIAKYDLLLAIGS